MTETYLGFDKWKLCYFCLSVATKEQSLICHKFREEKSLIFRGSSRSLAHMIWVCSIPVREICQATWSNKVFTAFDTRLKAIWALCLLNYSLRPLLLDFTAIRARRSHDDDNLTSEVRGCLLNAHLRALIFASMVHNAQLIGVPAFPKTEDDWAESQTEDQ